MNDHRLLTTLFAAGACSALLVFSGIVAGAEDAPTYVGAEKCKMCHMKEYKTWKDTPMAKAWERIKEEKDKELCYSCHTTGFGKPGGFVSEEKTPELVGVQCEVCHGPGGEHTALPIKEKDPAVRKSTINKNIQDCRSCHSPHVPNKAADVREKAKKTEG